MIGRRNKRRWAQQASSGGVFSPLSLSDLSLWLDGRATVFSDTGGTTPAVAPTGRVKNIKQPAPLTGSWLASTDAVRGWREAECVDIQLGDVSAFAQPTATLPANNCTLAFACQFRASQPGGNSNAGMVLWGTDSSGNFGFWWNGGGIFSVQTKSVQYNPGINIIPGDRMAMVMNCDATGLHLSWTINGGTVQTAFRSDAALPSGNISTLVAGQGAGINGHLSLAQVVGTRSALGATDVTRLLTWLGQRVTEPPVTSPLLVVVGDSLGLGFGLITESASQFYLAQKGLNATLASPFRMINASENGQSIETAITRYATRVVPRFSSSRSKNILFVQVGAASIADSSGLTAAQVLANLYSYCDQARADGWKVIISTYSPITNASVGAGFDARRLLVNTDILGGNGALHSDAISDVANVAGISLTTDCSGPNFLADNQHYSTAGHALATVVRQSAINSLLP